jgi:drug/metabolite transporter (DMT)-like permease
MFLGMSFLVLNTPLFRTFRCPRYVPGQPARGWGLFRLVAIPACCDLTASILQSVALLYLVPSVWQIFRGSILLFTALFAICYRHRRLRPVDWAGVVVTIIGITIVGISAVVNRGSGDDKSAIRNSSTGMRVLSMFLMIIAQGFQAFQTIVEEELLHDVDADVSEIVAFEGFWGLYLQTFITMPLANILPEDAGEGLFEHSIESFKMLFSSGRLAVITVLFCLTIAGLNWSGMHVTSVSSAIHRNIYAALRPIAVWALSVIVYYVWPDSGAGEKVDKWSLLQGAGFIVSVFGSFIYNRVIKLPFCKYDDEDEELNSGAARETDGPYAEIK